MNGSAPPDLAAARALAVTAAGDAGALLRNRPRQVQARVAQLGEEDRVAAERQAAAGWCRCCVGGHAAIIGLKA